MNTEEKAKRYDEALEVCKKLYNEAKANEYTSDMEDYESIFPELKESEDERIRKEIINYFEHFPNIIVKKERRNDWIAWLEKQCVHANFRNKIQIGDKVTRNRDGVLVNLSQLNRVAKVEEKQGEQKPAVWSEEDEEKMNWVIATLNNCSMRNSECLPMNESCEDWLKSLKYRVQPKQEWSEEDEKIRQDTIRVLEEGRDKYIGNSGCFPSWSKSISWLKSLRPQNRWKPSDEQIIALRWVLNNIPYNKHKEEISGLLDQIKDL